MITPANQKSSRFEQAGSLRYVPQASSLLFENGYTFTKIAISRSLSANRVILLDVQAVIWQFNCGSEGNEL